MGDPEAFWPLAPVFPPFLVLSRALREVSAQRGISWGTPVSRLAIPLVLGTILPVASGLPMTEITFPVVVETVLFTPTLFRRGNVLTVALIFLFLKRYLQTHKRQDDIKSAFNGFAKLAKRRD